MNVVTLFVPETRRPSFRDVDGTEIFTKAEDDVETYTVDWSDVMSTGETISSATWTDYGVTSSGEAISGQTTSASISGTDGYVIVTIVTSLTRTLTRALYFMGTVLP